MNTFYIGLLGALVGGLMLAATVWAIFLYEVAQRKKKASELEKEFNSLLGELKGLARSDAKSSGKFN